MLFIRKDLKDKRWGRRFPTLQEQEFHDKEDLSLEQLKEVAPRNIVDCARWIRWIAFVCVCPT